VRPVDLTGKMPVATVAGGGENPADFSGGPGAV